MTDPSTFRARRSTRRSAGRVSRKAIVLAGVAGLTTVSVAYAAWSANGNGNGNATSRARQAVTLAPATVTADLYPGANGDVVVTITNPNPYKVKLLSVAPGAGGITAGNAGCNVADAVSYRFSSLALSGAIAANGGTYTLTIDDAVAMDNDANDDCADTTFTVPLTVSAASEPSATTSTSGTVAA